MVSGPAIVTQFVEFCTKWRADVADGKVTVMSSSSVAGNVTLLPPPFVGAISQLALSLHSPEVPAVHTLCGGVITVAYR